MNRAGRPLLALLAIVTLSGCSYDSSANDYKYAGTWTGTWVNVSDASDHGTSTWTIQSSGAVSGTDIDPTLGISYHVAGTITKEGQLTSTATPTPTVGAPASLNGTLALGTGNNSLAGDLVWGVSPPLTYHYTLTRSN